MLNQPQFVEVDAGKTFGIGRYDGFLVPALATRSPRAPAVDPNYVFRAEILFDLIVWWGSLVARMMGAESPPSREVLWLFGGKGAGKTSVIEQFLARLGVALHEISGRHEMNLMDEAIATRELVGGDTIPSDGIIARAMRAGEPILINEADAIKPTEWIALHDLVERGEFTVPVTGERLVATPGFAITVAANSNGGGDLTGMYQGVKRQNAAFMSRCTFVSVDYPSEEVELEILGRKVPALPEDVRQVLVRVANLSRVAHLGDDSDTVKRVGGMPDTPICTRTLVRWAEKAAMCMHMAQFGIELDANDKQWPLRHSLDTAIALGGDPGSRVALRKCLELVIGG